MSLSLSLAVCLLYFAGGLEAPAVLTPRSVELPHPTFCQTGSAAREFAFSCLLALWLAASEGNTLGQTRVSTSSRPLVADSPGAM